MTLPDTTPSRKQRFQAALKLAGLTTEGWCSEHGGVTSEHLRLVLGGERTGSADLNAAIDGLIEKYLPNVAA